MTLQQMETMETERKAESGDHDFDPNDVLEQLERIVTSSLFRNSKRYPAFLRYTVEHTLAGQTHVLKERTLGIEVFGRALDYDTNADPVVRTTAGEIRKRLAQYYAIPGHEHELRFDLPIGSYVAHFAHPPLPGGEPSLHPLPPQTVSQELGTLPDKASGVEPSPLPAIHDAVEEPSKLTERKARIPVGKLLLATLVPVAVVLAIFTTLRSATENARTRAANLIWGPILHSEAPALIVIGVHSLGPDGRDISPANQKHANLRESQSMLSSMISSDMVPVSDVVSYSSVVSLLAHDGHAFRTESASATTFDQLQHGPVMLIGGLDNLWTLRLTSGLRFHFEEGGSVGRILDGQRPQTAWSFDNAQQAVANAKDYAIVASFQDPQTEQHVLVAAGIGKSGTAAAARFLTTEAYLQSWLAHANLNGKTNVELVLSTDMVEGQQGPPHVVADYSW